MVLSQNTWSTLTAPGTYQIKWIWGTTGKGGEMCNANGPQLANGVPDATVLLACGKMASLMGNSDIPGHVYSGRKEAYETTTGGQWMDVTGSWDTALTTAGVRSALSEGLGALSSMGCPS
jgi:hypothetical protein